MYLSPVLLALLPLFSGAAVPDESPPVILELFTSEGCSSCPPADQILALVAAHGNVSGVPVITLSEHVDYWNYLGWRDPFSRAAFSQRQQNYARRFRLESAYTPQLVVDGATELLGSDAKRASAAIAAAASAAKTPVRVQVASTGNNKFSVHVEAPAAAGSEILAALVTDSAVSEVNRGENSGRRLSHASVVRDLIKVGVSHRDGYNGDFTLDAGKAAVRDADRVVILVQENGQGRISGAAAAPLPR